VRHKQITLLLPDAEVHGVFTTAMIAEIVTDEWVSKWKLEKKLAKWATDWGVTEVKTPTGAEICDALFTQPPLEWSRITPFQDRTMVLMCKRLLPEAEKRDIYLQGASSFKLHKGHFTVSVYCSPHNPGAKELAEELNGIWPGLLQVADVQSWTDLSKCDHMLVYLNAETWTHDPERLAAEIREAMRAGLHLQPCHEYPSVTDPGSERQALEFKQVMDSTPADLKKSPTNISRQIAIALKGGELREPGLANLAARLAQRSGSTAMTTYSDAQAGSVPLSSAKKVLKDVLFGYQRVIGLGASPAILENDINVGTCHPEEASSRRTGIFVWPAKFTRSSRRCTQVQVSRGSAATAVATQSSV